MSRPPSRETTATASLSYGFDGWWDKRHCTYRRFRPASNVCILAGRLPKETPVTRYTRPFISRLILTTPRFAIRSVVPYRSKKKRDNGKGWRTQTSRNPLWGTRHRDPIAKYKLPDLAHIPLAKKERRRLALGTSEIHPPPPPYSIPPTPPPE